MIPSQIIEHVKRNDWRVVGQSGIVGPDAGPALLPLLEEPDSQIRELVLACLNTAGGPAARQGLIQALRDPTETVRAAAAQFLQAHYTPEDIPTIVRELNDSPDEYVREHLSLLLGTTGDASLIPFLLGRLRVENDQHAQLAASLALARLGEPASRQQLIDRIRQNDERGRVAAVRSLLYVKDRSLLAQLVPLLDDTRVGLNAGPSHVPYHIRVSDVAVNVANDILGGQFSWAERAKRYSPQELNEAKTVLSAIR